MLSKIMEYNKVCESCGKRFLSKTPSARFCGGVCRVYKWRETHKGYYRKRYHENADFREAEKNRKKVDYHKTKNDPEKYRLYLKRKQRERQARKESTKGLGE